jgi:hypothetical protein
MIDHKDLRKKIELYSIILLVVLSVGYGLFRAYPLLEGPEITIYSPEEGDKVSNKTFELSGKVSRVKEVTIQGRPIPIGTDGHFTETLIADSPYTILILTATDYYGKTITKTLRVSPEKS